MQQIRMVLVAPPSESLRRRVSLEGANRQGSQRREAVQL
jgi:hypothetical protein